MLLLLLVDGSSRCTNPGSSPVGSHRYPGGPLAGGEWKILTRDAAGMASELEARLTTRAAEALRLFVAAIQAIAFESHDGG